MGDKYKIYEFINVFKEKYYLIDNEYGYNYVKIKQLLLEAFLIYKKNFSDNLFNEERIVKDDMIGYTLDLSDVYFKINELYNSNFKNEELDQIHLTKLDAASKKLPKDVMYYDKDQITSNEYFALHTAFVLYSSYNPIDLKELLENEEYLKKKNFTKFK